MPREIPERRAFWGESARDFGGRSRRARRTSGVPVVIAGGGVTFGNVVFRFFREAPHGEYREAEFRKRLFDRRLLRAGEALDIAKSGFGSCGGNPEDDHAARIGSDSQRGADNAAILLSIPDEVIGG